MIKMVMHAVFYWKLNLKWNNVFILITINLLILISVYIVTTVDYSFIVQTSVVCLSLTNIFIDFRHITHF